MGSQHCSGFCLWGFPSFSIITTCLSDKELKIFFFFFLALCWRYVPRGVGLCEGCVSFLISMQGSFSQLGEKLAFNPQTMRTLGIWASLCPTEVPWVVPPHQSNPARAACWSWQSTAELKKLLHLVKAAKITMWYAAWYLFHLWNGSPFKFSCE